VSTPTHTRGNGRSRGRGRGSYRGYYTGNNADTYATYDYTSPADQTRVNTRRVTALPTCREARIAEPVKLLEKLLKSPSNVFQIFCGNRVISAIVDSGADISCLHPDMLQKQDIIHESDITLEGAFSDKIIAQTSNIEVKLNTPTAASTVLTVAITDKLRGIIALLTVDDHKELMSLANSIPQAEYISHTPIHHTCMLTLH